MHASGVFSLCAASPNRSRPSSSRPSSEGAVVWLCVMCFFPPHGPQPRPNTPATQFAPPIVVQTESAFQHGLREPLALTIPEIGARGQHPDPSDMRPHGPVGLLACWKPDSTGSVVGR